MIPLPRLLGLSLVLLLALVAAGLAAQAWLTRQEIRLEAQAVERGAARLESLLALTGGETTPWTDDRAATIAGALGARIDQVDVEPVAHAAHAGARLSFSRAWPDGTWLHVSIPPPPVDRILLLFQRVLLALGVFAVLLMMALIASSLWWRTPRQTHPPFAPPDLTSLAHLARQNVAQEQRLEQERDERQRAEEAARLRLVLLNRALEEKINLGRDLHDGIIQSLYATGLTVESARESLGPDAALTAARLEEAVAMINRAIADTRAYIKGLAPERVRRDSLAHGLRDLINELAAGRPLELDLTVGDAVPPALTDGQLGDLFQIVRESASNALRHGHAARISLSLEREPSGKVTLTLRDDGLGFNIAAPSSGHGLANLRARAEATGGQLILSSQPGRGTELIVRWPDPASSFPDAS